MCVCVRLRAQGTQSHTHTLANPAATSNSSDAIVCPSFSTIPLATRDARDMNRSVCMAFDGHLFISTSLAAQAKQSRKMQAFKPTTTPGRRRIYVWWTIRLANVFFQYGSELCSARRLHKSSPSPRRPHRKSGETRELRKKRMFFLLHIFFDERERKKHGHQPEGFLTYAMHAQAEKAQFVTPDSHFVVRTILIRCSGAQHSSQYKNERHALSFPPRNYAQRQPYGQRSTESRSVHILRMFITY